MATVVLSGPPLALTALALFAIMRRRPGLTWPASFSSLFRLGFAVQLANLLFVGGLTAVGLIEAPREFLGEWFGVIALASTLGDLGALPAWLAIKARVSSAAPGSLSLR